MICETCGDPIFPEVEEPEKLDEIVDLIAEAAKISPHAAQAYSLLRDEFDIQSLAARQAIVDARNRRVA